MVNTTMQTAIKDAEIGGNFKSIHFDGDGPFIGQTLPTSTTAAVSSLFDLGENLSGITVRGFADNNIGITGTGTLTVKIFTGDDKDFTPVASPASTSGYSEAATFTVTGTNSTAAVKAGDEVFVWTPTPGQGKKYYFATLAVSGTNVTGQVSVYNELTR